MAAYQQSSSLLSYSTWVSPACHYPHRNNILADFCLAAPPGALPHLRLPRTIILISESTSNDFDANVTKSNILLYVTQMDNGVLLKIKVVGLNALTDLFFFGNLGDGFLQNIYIRDFLPLANEG